MKVPVIGTNQLIGTRGAYIERGRGMKLKDYIITAAFLHLEISSNMAHIFIAGAEEREKKEEEMEGVIGGLLCYFF